MDFRSFFRLWKRWIGFFVVIAYVVILVIALPLMIWQLDRKDSPAHVQAWFIGGLFVLLALPISFWGILQHLINYTAPYLQRHIIRILWMVPIYALNAWFVLRFPSAAIYLDTLRECYEAYVVYNFMAYLLAFLNHDYPHLEVQIENKPPVSHIFPLCLLPPCKNGINFVMRCKHGVLQYTVVRPTMTIIALICEICDQYDEGDFNFTTAWSYIVIINNVSQILAMYCLVLFYKAFKEELQPLKPVPKFVCVKAVVFMSFWQAVLIAALAKLGAIPTNGTWVFYKNIKEVSTGLQDFLICIEMLLAAIAHHFCFSHKPFINLAAVPENCLTSFLSMWNVDDMRQDVVEHARFIGRGVQKKLRVGKKTSDEQTPLLGGRPSRSVNNLQLPTPAVVVEEDSLSSHYDSFVNRSITPSMNNFADFSTSMSEHRKSFSSSVSLLPYEDGMAAEVEMNNEDVNANSNRIVEVHMNASGNTIDTKRKLQEVHPDDEFEHLDVDMSESGREIEKDSQMSDASQIQEGKNEGSAQENVTDESENNSRDQQRNGENEGDREEEINDVGETVEEAGGDALPGDVKSDLSSFKHSSNPVV